MLAARMIAARRSGKQPGRLSLKECGSREVLAASADGEAVLLAAAQAVLFKGDRGASVVSAAAAASAAAASAAAASAVGAADVEVAIDFAQLRSTCIADTTFCVKHPEGLFGWDDASGVTI